MQQVERVSRGRGFRHWLIDVPANRAQCQVPLISLPLTEKRKERESTGAKSSRWSSNAPNWAGWQTDTRLGWCCLGNPSLLDEVVVCLAVTLTYSQKQFSKLLKDEWKSFHEKELSIDSLVQEPDSCPQNVIYAHKHAYTTICGLQ